MLNNGAYKVGEDDEHWMVLDFGPLSVLPEYQRKGVGGTLIRAMIERAKQLDYGAILFFGRPEYYPKFGFKEAKAFEIADADGYNYPSFMAMELKTGYLKEACGGRYFESDIYNDTVIDDISWENGSTVETVCLLSKLHEAKHHVNVKLDMDELDLTSAESKATYEEFKKYVAEHNDGLKVSSLNIAQVKRKCGLELAENFNLPKTENSRQPQCPKEKEDAIMEALKAFQMV